MICLEEGDQSPFAEKQSIRPDGHRGKHRNAWAFGQRTVPG